MGLRALMRSAASSRRSRRPHGRPPPPSFFTRPCGHIDAPDDGACVARAPIQLLGWCLMPGSVVTRVDVSAAGGPPERARIGIERLDIGLLCSDPYSPICGFEHKFDLGQLPADVRDLTLETVAHAADGRRVALDPVRLSLADPEEPFEDTGGRTAQLRERSSRYLERLQVRGASSRLRILVITHQIDYSGGSLYLFEVVSRLASGPDVECELISLADGPLRDELESRGVPVHVADGFPVTTVERYEGNQAELIALIASRGFDVALVNTLGCFAGADVADRLGLPVVWTIHESFRLPEFWFTAYPPGVPHPYACARAEEALRRANAIVFEAEATRQLYLPHADPDRLVTLPYGIELGAIDAARRTRQRPDERRRLGIEEGTRAIVCLGTIEARKSQSMLAAAFAQVAARHPEAQLILVGQTDAAYCADYNAALREYVERSGLRSRVRIEPVTSDPYSWHSIADVLVCSSDVESLPRVILEAMAFGTPVLSTAVFGIPELIEHGRTGYLCEPRDVGALAVGLDTVLSATPDELRAVAEAGAERVRERHDAASYARVFERLIRRAAANPHADPRGLLGQSLVA